MTERLAAAPPPAWVERMREQLGPEVDAFLAAAAAPETGLRVNTLRAAPERFRALEPWGAAPLHWLPEGFFLPPDARPGRHPYHAAGLFYLQDPGAMAVGALLDPRPGERVLDLAAAPGGKSTHLAARMADSGLLVANDVHGGRARELAGNLERCGVSCALVTHETPERIADHFGSWFDRVLLDAPCSGESMFHKSAAARADWSPAAVLGCARRQEGLLATAARCVRPGGLLVYSTCTFAPEENEAAVGAFLDAHPDFAVATLAAVPGAEPGRPDWAGGAARAAEIAGTARLWPHRVAGAGHFVAGLRRADDGEPARLAPRAEQRPPSAVAAAVRAMAEAVLRDPEALDGRWWIRGEELFRLPEGTPELGRLRVERPGLWAASLPRGRAEPAHALAMALRPGDAARTLDFPADSSRAAAFLRGETVAADGEPGWVQVTVDGFPLGWGKRVGGTVKNHLPKGLRQR